MKTKSKLYMPVKRGRNNIGCIGFKLGKTNQMLTFPNMTKEEAFKEIGIISIKEPRKKKKV